MQCISGQLWGPHKPENLTRKTQTLSARFTQQTINEAKANKADLNSLSLESLTSKDVEQYSKGTCARD